MTKPDSPALSVVLVTLDRFEALRRTLECLRRQSARCQLEIVVAAPSAAGLALNPADMADFWGHQVVEVGPIEWTAAARAAAIRCCRAPLIALAEDHCYPAQGWAAAFIAAHRQDWAAVGPAFNNANPRSALSWASLALEYGPYIEPVEAGEVKDLPGHNSCYKRDVLLAYGQQLPTMLEIETVLHQDLRARGGRLFLEPAARVFHINMTQPGVSLRTAFLYGRLFAAARARSWPIWRRVLYVVAAPLIPCVRLWRALHVVRRVRGLGAGPRLLPGLALLVTASGLGELAGNLLGPGGARQQLVELDFKRERYLAPGDSAGEPA